MRNRRPNFIVDMEVFDGLRDGSSHLFTMPLNKKNLRFLPKAYADTTNTILIFPKSECPKEFSFQTMDGQTCVRQVVNIMAYKQEDGSEIIKVRLK